MNGILPSEAVGPAFLSLLLGAAILVAVQRRNAPPDAKQIVTIACLTLAVHVLHVCEEYLTGFHRRLPDAIGLDPWSADFFVAFNLSWIALWLLGLAALARGRAPLAAAASLWFLALAAIGNAVWHPILSLLTGDYFPGLVTAVPVGACGWLLAKRLAADSPRKMP